MKANQSKGGYFDRVARETPTELWVNNATVAEAKAALAAGARGASTNPTYPIRLLKQERDDVMRLIDETIQESSDDHKVADLTYQKMVARLQQLLHPLYRRSQGRWGYVAIQGDPRVNHDAEAIMEGALRYRQLGENMIIKVPATPAGAVAMERLTVLGHPTIATLGFSVDQAVYMAEAYRRALARSSTRPACLITYIAGILDEHLTETAQRQGDEALREMIKDAGVAGNRAAYRVFKERAYEAVLIGGGARGAHHFTELVGGEMAITIGWNLIEQLLKEDGPVVRRMDAATPADVLARLEERLPDFKKASRLNALRPEEFVSFGPVARFQNTFLTAYDGLLKTVAERRLKAATPAATLK